MKPTKQAAEMTVRELASYIDHSVLKPEFTIEDVERETRNAIEFGCRTVCVNPASLEIAVPLCEGTGTGVCVVVDFPFGASSTDSKVEQTRLAVAEGADEIDVVANYGWIRSGRLDLVQEDLRAVIAESHAGEVPVKVILETDALTEEQIRAGVEVAIAAGADYVKTSTGFYTGENRHEKTGASDEMIALLLDVVGGRSFVKGSGSIRDRAHFLRLIDAGVDRLGIGYRSAPEVLGISENTSRGAGGY